ncbi:PrgI family protein [Candidatus Saccharibacteria bacterium]|nr:PrgI family protein [Candidatus Saccharibacteria bacterium]
MGSYKVPQDVEAEDKLLGPFSFRQFIYLLIAAGLLAAAFGLYRIGGIVALFAIVPIPPALVLVILALPLRKEQTMTQYLTAVLKYHLNPKTRVWQADGIQHDIKIEAPKVVDAKSRVRNIERGEANKRLSFLANIVDSEGRAVKESNLSDNILMESETAPDMFDNYSFALDFDKTVQRGNINLNAENDGGIMTASTANNNIGGNNATIQQ